MNNYIIETDRLIIRPISVEDAEFILELLNSPKFIQNIGDRELRTVEDARNYIEIKMLPQLHKYGFSNNALIEKESNQKIGTCGIFAREGVEGFDIGYALLPEFEGKGFAYEAALKIKEAALNDFGLNEIFAYTTKNNLPSQNLLTKLGMKLSGTTYFPNDEEELLVYKS